MSVPKWKQRLSHVKYLWCIYQFTIRVSQIVENKPKKYKGTYSDKLIKLSLCALEEAMMGNEIYVRSKKDYEERRLHLLRAKGYLSALLPIGDIFLELCKEGTGADIHKLTKNQFEIGNRVEEILNLLTAVIDSDKKRYAKLT